MSDFGTMLVAAKKNGGSFNDSERTSFSEALQTIIEDAEMEDASGEPFGTDVTIEEAYGEYPPHLLVRLSEHYFGDEEETSESMEFIEDIELDLVDEMISTLSGEFPDYEFKRFVVEW